jgi:hypothetical protein
VFLIDVSSKLILSIESLRTKLTLIGSLLRVPSHMVLNVAWAFKSLWAMWTLVGFLIRVGPLVNIEVRRGFASLVANNWLISIFIFTDHFKTYIGLLLFPQQVLFCR